MTLLSRRFAQEWRVHVRFLLGPAGSGKTYRCLAEIRDILSRSPEGPPLILLAPNQATFQLERQLLADAGIQGYTRLHVLSFERLARQLFDWLEKPCPELLDDEGRVMVLRALLTRQHKELKLFRASARLTGFAQQLSNVLREFQQHQITPESLDQLAARMEKRPSLAYKLQDLAALLREYAGWLQSHDLQDGDCLLSNAARLLAGGETGAAPPRLEIEALWVDGFAELTAEELDLLRALLPGCRCATLTFCLDEVPGQKVSWLSSWSVSRRAFETSQKRLASLAAVSLSVEKLARDPLKSRFQHNRILQHLEQHWAEPKPISRDIPAEELGHSLRVAVCGDQEAEVTLAAREILTYVRGGGRYRDVTVLVRNLEDYHHDFQRLFARYEIPFFLDRRESMAHHPVAELTRSALRTVALGWQHEDWFAALKTGLVSAGDEDIDGLENEALARGWRGAAWQQPLRIGEVGRSADETQRLRRLEAQLEALRQKVVAPFQKLALTLRLAGNKPTGKQLAAALREFWETLNIAAQLGSQQNSAWVPGPQASDSIHETVWNQMNCWVDNIELAFAGEAVALREWLPILEAGLANLTVGLIPPALDQVVVGAIDRSRNPDIKLALVLGVNEAVFPALPESGGLLTESDRAELEKQDVLPASTARQQLSRERYYAYIACTRARQRLVLTCALRDQNGKVLNPSPFLGHLRQLFPSIHLQTPLRVAVWQECQHPADLLEALPADGGWVAEPQGLPAWLAQIKDCDCPGLSSVATALEQLQACGASCQDQALGPVVATRLYGPVFRTSVSRMEQFAACPFKFFVHSGLRAQERKRFELDSREQGSFQHDVLAMFHEQLQAEKKSWRDITPGQARERVSNIAQALAASYHEGLLEATEQARFMARVLTESLQDFVETLVGWMGNQYLFDPVAVELPFGPDEASPAWSINLQNGRQLELYGRIDRVDLFREAGSDAALCVVVDYKSSQKQLDPVLINHGLQLQLLTYLNVLRHWPNPCGLFGVSRLIPAGVFYVNLRGKTSYEQNRLDALGEAEEARRLAYRHSGRFDAAVLPRLDCRPEAQQGDQFNYRRTKDRSLNKSCREPVGTSEFVTLLDSVETALGNMGRQVYEGVAEVSPFRKGSLTACQQCEYQSICRIDPWTQRFRLLKRDDQTES